MRMNDQPLNCINHLLQKKKDKGTGRRILNSMASFYQTMEKKDDKKLKFAYSMGAGELVPKIIVFCRTARRVAIFLTLLFSLVN